LIPMRVEHLQRETVVHVDAGGFHTLAVAGVCRCAVQMTVDVEC